jgi:hypothetical protein
MQLAVCLIFAAGMLAFVLLAGAAGMKREEPEREQEPAQPG